MHVPFLYIAIEDLRWIIKKTKQKKTGLIFSIFLKVSLFYVEGWAYQFWFVGTFFLDVTFKHQIKYIYIEKEMTKNNLMTTHNKKQHKNSNDNNEKLL